MPISWYESIPAVVSKVQEFQPQSILDVGVGFGKYGVLLREALELPFKRYQSNAWTLQIDGVEAFPDYRNELHEFAYNHIYYNDITEIVDTLPVYDVILMIDVLEHFEKDVGKALLKSLTQHCKKGIIISTPRHPDLQEEYLGNHFEAHKSRWTNLDFSDFDFTLDFVQIGTNSAQIFVVYPPQTHSPNLAAEQIPAKLPTLERKELTVGYFLPHHNLTGGLKMLLEQMRHLQQRGHRIVAFYRGKEGEHVLPNWVNMRVSKEVLVPPDEPFLAHVTDCDIGIAGWVEQLPELASANIPIVYWEQGNEWLFGEHLSPVRRLHLQRCYGQPVSLAGVSPIVSKALETRFHRKSTLIPNGIDVNFYHPGNPPGDNLVLLVGNPNLQFKGFDVAIRALFRAWNAGCRFRVKWISPVNVQLNNTLFPFPVESVVNPTQESLAKSYRESDLFLFTSWFEGFGMPPLEAMASGVPVVCTRCGGVEIYAKNDFNAVLADPGDVDRLSAGIVDLLNHPQKRSRLAKNGRLTAMQFSFDNIVSQLEQYLMYLVDHYKT